MNYIPFTIVLWIGAALLYATMIKVVGVPATDLDLLGVFTGPYIMTLKCIYDLVAEWQTRRT